MAVTSLAGAGTIFNLLVAGAANPSLLLFSTLLVLPIKQTGMTYSRRSNTLQVQLQKAAALWVPYTVYINPNMKILGFEL